MQDSEHISPAHWLVRFAYERLRPRLRDHRDDVLTGVRRWLASLTEIRELARQWDDDRAVARDAGLPVETDRPTMELPIPLWRDRDTDTNAAFAVLAAIHDATRARPEERIVPGDADFAFHSPYFMLEHRALRGGNITEDDLPELEQFLIAVLPATVPTLIAPTPIEHRDEADGPPPPKLRPNQFELPDGRIVSRVSPKQVQLLSLLKEAGEAGVHEDKVLEHLDYKHFRGPRRKTARYALTQLAHRANDAINRFEYMVRSVSLHWCLHSTATKPPPDADTPDSRAAYGSVSDS